MPTVTLEIDARTAERLAQIGAETGDTIDRTASRLLARAARAAGTRPRFDADSVRETMADLAADELILADSASTERADLLLREDEA